MHVSIFLSVCVCARASCVCIHRIGIGNGNKYEIDLKLRLTDRELKCQNKKEIFDMESAIEFNIYYILI